MGQNSDNQDTAGLDAASILKATEEKEAAEKEQEKKEEKNLKFRSVVLYAFAAMTLLIILIPGSSGWLKLHNLMRGIFGISIPVLPAVCFRSARFLEKTIQGKKQKKHHPETIAKYFLYGFLCAGLVSGFVQIMIGGDPGFKNPGKTIQELYRMGIDNMFSSGGVISFILAYPLFFLLGDVGAKICICIILFLVCMWLMDWDMHDLWDHICIPFRKLKDFLFLQPQTISEENIPEFQEETGKLGAFGRLKQKFSKKKNPPEELPAEEPLPEPEPLPEEAPPETDGFVPDFVLDDSVYAPETEPCCEPEQEIFEPFQIDIPVDGSESEATDAPEPEPESQPEQQPASDLDAFFYNEPEEDAPAEEPEVLESVYRIPPLHFLQPGINRAQSAAVQQELNDKKETLLSTLQSFGVTVRIPEISRGPAVTRYEVQPAAGIKVSKITGLADDIALSLAAEGVRIEAPIPGKSAIGIEVPNSSKDIVSLREILESDAFQKAESKLSFAVGKDIAGNPIVGDIAKMPHMIIAGATGSGKSVCTNSIIMSILFHATPDEVKLILIDPKIVEFRVYENIPHLLIPVVTDAKKAAGALNWAVQEMLRRYQLFADNNTRDLTDYNRKAAENPDLPILPQIVIAIDELADLMMVASKEVEDAICRLAQMARAAGMHLIIATQRPTTDIITGLIKANIPSRIALSVMSQVDSRTILDTGGAEKLLGHGDMLYFPNGMPKPVRVQGCYVSTKEIETAVEFIKQQVQTTYDDQIIQDVEQSIPISKAERSSASEGSNSDDQLIEAAIETVVEMGQASTSSLQRRLKLGYARAARIMDELEKMGVIGPYEGAKPRKVLMTKQQYAERKLRNLQ